jgi:hypothetical protein
MATRPSTSEDNEDLGALRKLLVDLQATAIRLQQITRLSLVAKVFLLVLIIALEIQVQSRNHTIEQVKEQVKIIQESGEQTKQAAAEARSASLEAQQALETAIAQVGTPSPEALASRESIKHIEQMLAQHVQSSP